MGSPGSGCANLMSHSKEFGFHLGAIKARRGLKLPFRKGCTVKDELKMGRWCQERPLGWSSVHINNDLVYICSSCKDGRWKKNPFPLVCLKEGCLIFVLKAAAPVCCDN